MAMYEHSETPLLRRIWWVIPGVVMLGLLIWLLTWLIFFHHTAVKQPLSIPKAPSSRSQSHTPPASTQPPQSSNSSTGPAPSSSSTANNQSSSPTPSQLANTGPGDVLLPVAVATVVGSGLYYIRLQRKYPNR